MRERHLFLTSSGLTLDMKKKFFDIIGKRPEDVKVLYIPTAGMETDEAREGFALCLDELSKMGVCYENILVYNLELLLSKDYKRTYSAHIKELFPIARLFTEEEMKMFDAVFVSGGDSKVLCREMVRTGFDKILETGINQGIVYVGVSAGSMYVAGNLEDGLHIINNPIIPHWDGTKLVEIPSDGKEILLADGQAVYVEGNSSQLI